MNTHDDFKILISAYYDGETSSTEKQKVEAHLKECASCRKYLLELQTLSSSLKKWSDETPSPDLEQKIHNFSTAPEGGSTGYRNFFREASKEGNPMKISTIRITQMAGSVLVVLFLAIITLNTIARNTMQARI